MHLIPLNIMKNLWKLWNCEKLDVDKNPHTRGSYVLSNEVTGDNGFIDRVLKSARRDVPLALGNVAKRYVEFKSFKAADWQDFIEIYGISLMYENLADDAFMNLVKLHEVWCLASKRSISLHEISKLNQACLDFVGGYQSLYYRGDKGRLPACSINNHWLLHLASGILKNGPSCYNWSFPLERFCYTVKKLARSKSLIAKSISNALMRSEQYNLINLLEGLDDSQHHPDLEESTEYPILSGLMTTPSSQFQVEANSAQIFRQPEQLENQSIHPTMIKYWKRCKLSTSLTIGSVVSQYNSDWNRINHFVCYANSDRTNAPCAFGSIQIFLTSPSGKEYGILQQWTRPEYDAEIHQITYENETGGFVLIKPKDIICIVGVLKEKDMQMDARVLKMIIGPPILQQSIRERGLANS